MIITKYVCDRCGKEITGGTRRICIEDGSYNHINIPELEHVDFCENCIKDMVILMTGKPTSDEEEITRRYRNGEEMEAIADDMNCDLVVVSKFVDKQDLGKERYGQKKV